MSERNTIRNHSIDCIKGIAILFVLVTHYKWTTEEELTLLFPYWIDMAVPFFMVASGYVSALSYSEKGIKEIGDCYRADIIFSRIIRYTVPFMVAFFIELLVYFWLKSNMRDILIIGLGTDNLSFINILKMFISGGNGPGSYYYPLLIPFPFVFPVIYFLCVRKGLKGVYLSAIINILYEVLKWAYDMNEECYRLLIFRYLMLISFGCFLAIRDDYKMTLEKAACLLLSGFIYILCVKYFDIKPIITEYWSGTCVFACLYILPLAFLLFRINFPRLRFFEYIGRASYYIFLTQLVYYQGAEFIYQIIDCRVLQLGFSIFVCCFVGIIFKLLCNGIIYWSKGTISCLRCKNAERK